MTTVRYFAAAEEAAGTSSEQRSETTLTALRTALAADHPDLAALLPQCAVLVDGQRHDDDADLADSSLVDVLPPFAGG